MPSQRVARHPNALLRSCLFFCLTAAGNHGTRLLLGVEPQDLCQGALERDMDQALEFDSKATTLHRQKQSWYSEIWFSSEWFLISWLMIDDGTTWFRELLGTSEPTRMFVNKLKPTGFLHEIAEQTTVFDTVQLFYVDPLPTTSTNCCDLVLRLGIVMACNRYCFLNYI